MTDREENLDETIEETFPASDAPANTPQTGVRIGATGRSDRTTRGGPDAETKPGRRRTDLR
jgi:hypothetical protein